MKCKILLTILTSVLILINGCVQQIAEEEKPEAEFCEIGKGYEHNAVNPITCECPEGYEFKTISISWGPCPKEGMSDCPASVLKCVKETPTIGEIISNPELYKGKEVILTGKYGGWGYCEGALKGITKLPKDVSRSAVVIFDETGCIYFENVEWISDKPTSDAWEPMNESITIKGKVYLDEEGTPYIHE